MKSNHEYIKFSEKTAVIVEFSTDIIIEAIKKRFNLRIRSKLYKCIMASINLDTYKKGEKWRAYVEQLNSFILFKDIPREKRKDFLITQLSTPVYEILCNICFPDSPQNPKFTFDDLLKKLDDYLSDTEKYVAHFEYNKEKQGVQESIKEYKFTEKLSQGVKTEAMCFKVYRGADSIKDFVNFATEIEWNQTATLDRQNNEVSGNKSGIFAVSGYSRSKQQHDRNKSFDFADDRDKVPTADCCYCDAQQSTSCQSDSSMLQSSAHSCSQYGFGGSGLPSGFNCCSSFASQPNPRLPVRPPPPYLRGQIQTALRKIHNDSATSGEDSSLQNCCQQSAGCSENDCFQPRIINDLFLSNDNLQTEAATPIKRKNSSTIQASELQEENKNHNYSFGIESTEERSTTLNENTTMGGERMNEEANNSTKSIEILIPSVPELGIKETRSSKISVPDSSESQVVFTCVVDKDATVQDSEEGSLQAGSTIPKHEFPVIVSTNRLQIPSPTQKKYRTYSSFMIDELTASPVAMKPEQSKTLQNSPREAPIPPDDSIMLQQQQKQQQHSNIESEVTASSDVKGQTMHSISHIIDHDRQKQQKMPETSVTYDKNGYKRIQKEETFNIENRKKKKVTGNYTSPQWVTSPYMRPYMQLVKPSTHSKPVFPQVNPHRQQHDKLINPYASAGNYWNSTRIQTYSSAHLDEAQQFNTLNMSNYNQNKFIRGVNYQRNYLPRDHSMGLQPGQCVEQMRMNLTPEDMASSKLGHNQIQSQLKHQTRNYLETPLAVKPSSIPQRVSNYNPNVNIHDTRQEYIPVQKSNSNNLSPNLITVNSYTNSGGIAIGENWSLMAATRHHLQQNHQQLSQGRTSYQTVSVPMADELSSRVHPISRPPKMTYHPPKQQSSNEYIRNRHQVNYNANYPYNSTINNQQSTLYHQPRSISHLGTMAESTTAPATSLYQSSSLPSLIPLMASSTTSINEKLVYYDPAMGKQPIWNKSGNQQMDRSLMDTHSNGRHIESKSGIDSHTASSISNSRTGSVIVSAPAAAKPSSALHASSSIAKMSMNRQMQSTSTKPMYMTSEDVTPSREMTNVNSGWNKGISLRCHQCGEPNASFVCSVCGIAVYCNRRCQSHHWSMEHFTQCNKSIAKLKNVD